MPLLTALTPVCICTWRSTGMSAFSSTVKSLPYSYCFGSRLNLPPYVTMLRPALRLSLLIGEDRGLLIERRKCCIGGDVSAGNNLWDKQTIASYAICESCQTFI